MTIAVRLLPAFTACACLLLGACGGPAAAALPDGGVPDGGAVPDGGSGVTFGGDWHGGMLNTNFSFGASSTLNPTLTGTTVGGTGSIDGYGPGTLSGTFDGTTWNGMFNKGGYHEPINLTLVGPFLVGLMTGDSPDAIVTFGSDAATPAPTSVPTQLSGTWKSRKTASTGSITITLGAPNSANQGTGQIAAGSLGSGSGSYGYARSGLQLNIGPSSFDVQLFGRGKRFVGGYVTATDLGVIDATAP